MKIALRYFRWEINAALLVLACAGIVTLGLDYVSTKHAQRRSAEKLCAAQVEAIRARNVWAQKAWCPSDPCACLAVVR